MCPVGDGVDLGADDVDAEGGGGAGDLRGADTQIDTSCVGMIGADHGIFRGASRPGAFGNRRPHRRGET